MAMERSRTVLYSVKALSNKIKHLLENVSLQLTGMQHAIIYYISSADKDEFYQRDIEAEFNMSRAAASGILTRMEKNGLITREVSKGDTRLKKITLTPVALEVNQSVHDEIMALESRILAGITAEELAVFFKVLGKVEHNIAEL